MLSTVREFSFDLSAAVILLGGENDIENNFQIYYVLRLWIDTFCKWHLVHPEHKNATWIKDADDASTLRFIQFVLWRWSYLPCVLIIVGQ